MKYLLILLLCLSPLVWADSHALYNYQTAEYLDKQDTDSPRSIASITKLFTAMTVINSKQPLDEILTVDCQNKGRVVKGSSITRKDLLTAMIVASDNCAAETLANSHVGGYHQFIVDRTALIASYNLKNTHLFDSTGLSPFNVSTVDDLIAFAPIAYQDEFLRTISNLPQASISARVKNRTVVIKLNNTNPAIYNHPEIVVSKTGFTNIAGRCVLMLVQKVQNVYAVVILGKPNLNSRNKEAERLLTKEKLS
jgi:D-alanyl-D-alanine endopeptidase (penicillin-binding protein 7)